MHTFDRVVFERTAQVAVAADGTTVAAQLIAIPTVNSVRPVAFEVADAAANLSVEVSESPDQSGQIELTATALLPNAGARRFILGPADQIALEAAAGATTADIRWFYPAGAVNGHAVAPEWDNSSFKTKTFTIVAPASEGAVTIPEKAVAMVIESVSANGVAYRVDDGTANGEVLPLLTGDAITVATPYVIHVTPTDRLRIEQIGGAANLVGYWLTK